MPKKNKTTRRRLLRGLGATALSLPFLRSFATRAQSEGALPKLLVFAAPNGFMVGPNNTADYAGWAPRGTADGDSPLDIPLDDSLRGIFAPLNAHRGDLVFLDGLRGTDGVNAHQQAAALLTGVGVFNDEEPRASGGDGEWYSQGESVDQMIARRIDSRVLGLSFDIRGFNLGEGIISHVGPNNGFTPIQDPVDAFERVFGDASLDDSARIARHVRQTSVLDRVAGDLTALKGPASRRRS